MKILWYNDIPLEYNGGAEKSIALWQERGREHGHTFYNVHIKNTADMPYYIKKADIAFISNIYHSHFPPVDMICKKLPYLKHEHDVGYCYLRDIHCRKWRVFMNDGLFPPCSACPYVANTEEQQLAEKHFLRYNKILNKAKAISFSSPIQRTVFMDALGAQDKPSDILRLPGIDTQYFRRSKDPRKGSLFIGDYASKKGVAYAFKYAVEVGVLHPVSFVGRYPNEISLPPNCRIYPVLPPKQLNKLYTSHEFLLQHPEVFDACPRTYLEAKLTNCVPLTNDNVGAMSWKIAHTTNIKKLRKALEEAPDKFWNDMEEFL